MVKEEIEVLDGGIDLQVAGPLGGCCYASMVPFK